MTAPNKMAKRAAAGTLALAVCLTGGAIGAGAAQAAPNFKFDQRISGETRFETAIEASKRTFPNAGQAKAIVLVNGDRTVDGLTASYVAGLQDASILYTDTNGYSAATKAEMDRLGTKNVHIVGGTTVVTTAVENQLRTDGYTLVKRYGGEDRYATAAQVAQSGSTKPNKLYIASGERLADALVVGPIATAKDYPILLVEANRVPGSTSSALDALGVTTRVVVGGTTVVSDSTYTAAKATGRLFGATRQETAIEVAKDAIKNEGFKTDSLALVGGNNNNAADALVAAPFAAQKLIPILFVDGDGLGATKGYLEANAAALTGQGYIFGGTNAVSTAAATAATAAAGGTGAPNPTPTPATGSTIAITPTDAVTQQLASTGTPVAPATVGAENGSTTDQNADNRSYTATGLTNGRTYRITLVDSNSIIESNGGVTFLSSADTESRSGFSADIGPDNADIIRVNGGAPNFAAAAAAAARTVTAVPNNGVITFEIDGTNPGSVRPVIYLDGGPGRTDAEGGTSARLETSATGAGVRAGATEPFGLGGQVTYTGPLAPNNVAFTNQVVASVNKGGDTFSTDEPFRYTYDSNDTFTVNNGSTDLAGFEAQLSSGDTVSGTFQQDSRGNSTFNLTDSNPGAPTGVTATRGSGSSGTTAQDVTVTGTFPGNLREVDDLIIQRATVNNGQTGDFVTIVTVAAADTDTGTAGVQFRHVDRGVAPGTVVYRVAAVNDGDQGPYSAASGPATVTGNTAGPTISDTRLSVNGGNALLLESGDSFSITSTKVFAAPTVGAAGVAGDLIRLQDADGTVFDVINGPANFGNATFSLNTTTVTADGVDFPAGRVLTVTLTATPTSATTTNPFAATSVAGTASGLAVPSTITNQSGNTDVDGNDVQLTGSQDLVVDQESATTTAPPPAGPPAGPADVAPPTFTTAPSTTAVVTFTANEALNATTIAASDFASAQGTGATAAPTVTSAVLRAGTNIIDVTLSAVPVTGNTLTLTANSISDTAGNAGPATALVNTRA